MANFPKCSRVLAPALALLVFTNCKPASVEVTGVVSLTGLANARDLTVTLTGRTTASTTTDEHGRYTFHAVNAGSYTVTAFARSTAEASQVLVVQVTDANVSTPALTFTPVGSLAGTVLLEGAPSNAGALVTSATGGLVAMTDGAGHFELTKVPVGTVHLSASKHGFLAAGSATVPVVYDQQTNVAPMRLFANTADAGADVGSVRGTAHLVGETNHAGIDVVLAGEGARFDTVTLDGGVFEFGAVPPGSYSLSFDKGRFHEVVPQVLATAGANAFLVDQQLHPLPVIRVPSGRRITQCHDCTEVVHRNRMGPFVVAQADWYWERGTLEYYSSLGAAPRTLLSIEELHAVEFSPDGTSLLVADATGVKLVPLAPGGVPTVLSTVKTFQAHFLPDGQAVRFISGAFDDSQGVLTVVSLDGGTLSESAAQSVAYELATSSDGSQVLFAEYSSGNTINSTLRVMPARGGPATELARAGGYFYAARFSNDGSRVYFLSGDSPSGPQSVKVVPSAGGPAQVLTTGINDVLTGSRSIEFSNDASRILYAVRDTTTNERTLNLQDFGTGQVTQLGGLQVGYSRRPAHFSPDGATVVFIDESGLHVVHGQRTTTLLTQTKSFGEDFAFSPDGSRVVLIAGPPTSGLKVVPLSGAPAVHLSGDPPNWAQQVANRYIPRSPWLDAHHVFVVDTSELSSHPQLYLLEVP